MLDKSSPKSKPGANKDVAYPQDLLAMDNLQLLDEVDRLVAADHPSKEDMDRVTQCLALLQERAPVMEDFDPKEGWNELVAEHPLMFEAEEETSEKTVEKASSATPKRRIGIRILRYVEAAVIALFVLIFTANALGHNPVQAFFRWADGVIQAYGNPSGVMEFSDSTVNEYRSLAQALAENGLDNSGCLHGYQRITKFFQLT